MDYIIPDYYEKFSCIGGDCPDNCCAGWEIEIDKPTLKKYKKEKSIFKNCLRNGINWKEKTFLQYNKKCVFLNEEGLCDIYSELGPDRLCKTCRTYPRHIEEFEGVHEVSLSMSCPVVAKMILTRQEPVGFLTIEDAEAIEEYPDFDYLLFTKLVDTRKAMLDMLQNRSVPFSERVTWLLGFAHDLQGRIYKGEEFSIDVLLEKYTKPQAIQFCKNKAEQCRNHVWEGHNFAKNIFKLLNCLEVRQEEWKEWLGKCLQNLREWLPVEYAKQKEKFYQLHCGTLAEQKEWERIQEQIVVYFLFTYYCGAVYDGNLYAKVKMAVISLFAIEEMLFNEWFTSGKKMQISDWIGYAYQYSRELEHSEKNLNIMESVLTRKKEYRLYEILYFLCMN